MHLTHREIRKRVYEKYPLTDAEKRCAEEKRIMTRLREKYTAELYEQTREKRDWSGGAEDKPDL